eukprot:s1984_g11.t1
MLPPFSVAYIKGWRRSVSALIVAEAVRELGLEAELRPDYKVLETAGSIARAYAVGPKEAAAILQLTTRVAPAVTDLLKDAVRKRGMRGFLTHEAIAKEIFSEAWSSGVGLYEAWNDALTNREDRKLVSLLIARMCADWDRQQISGRKGWGSKDLQPLHSACGGFLAFLRALKDKLPPNEYEKHSNGLQEQSISKEIEQKQVAELEEKDRELAMRVADATLEQLKSKLESDMKVLEEAVPTAEKEAKETQLDLKKGQAYTKAWMEEHCKLVTVEQENLVSYVKDIAQHISKLQETYALVVVDVTVYPANAKLVSTALDSMGLLLNMNGNNNAGHVQLPTCHTNTTSQVVYKHRRLVEDNLMSSQKLDISQTVALHSKPDEAHASDKRGGVQTCLQAEFARAICAKKLRGARYPVYYAGFLGKHQKDVVEGLEESIYTSWDQSSSAPPKQRPRESAEVPRLTTILWQNNRPVFPSSILSKFAEESDHYNELIQIKKKLEGLWPASQGEGSSSASSVPRAVGSPDFSGTEVLDISREVSLAMTPMDGFAEERLALCPGKGGKPSVLITKSFDIYLGNPTDDEEMVVPSSDIMGFYTGAYEVKIIKSIWGRINASTGPLEKHTIPWRLESDMTLVAVDKKVMPVCSMMCNAARERGIGELAIGDHEASNTDDGGEEAVMPYRYEITPEDSFKTNCFKPNVLNANCDPEAHKPWALGAVMAGNFDRLPRQDKNKTASLVWEARTAADRGFYASHFGSQTQGVPHVLGAYPTKELGIGHKDQLRGFGVQEASPKKRPAAHVTSAKSKPKEKSTGPGKGTPKSSGMKRPAAKQDVETANTEPEERPSSEKDDKESDKAPEPKAKAKAKVKAKASGKSAPKVKAKAKAKVKVEPKASPKTEAKSKPAPGRRTRTRVNAVGQAADTTEPAVAHGKGASAEAEGAEAEAVRENEDASAEEAEEEAGESDPTVPVDVSVHESQDVE